MKINCPHNIMAYKRLAVALSVLTAISILPQESIAESKEPRKVRIGYFEGGKYSYHDRLKDEFYRQLTAILPDSIEVVFAPEGYRSAEWDRAKSTEMANELAGVETIDLVVAAGPWVIRDLLDAGFTKPIIGVHQFAPQYEELLDKKGKPIAENLTLHYQKNKIESDLTKLSSMMRLKRLGFLYFPSSNEADSVLAEAKVVGQKFGFEVITSTGENNKGTFAFFNAYGKLDKNIDALYVGPMWGCDIQMINQFFYNTNHDKIPVMTSEDRFLVDRGAFLTNNAHGIYSEARFSAYKTKQIILGKKPAKLAVEFQVPSTLAVNEAAARKNRISIEPKLYSEAYVVPAPPDEDVTIVTLGYAIPRAFSLNSGDSAQFAAIESAVMEAIRVQDSLSPIEKTDKSEMLGTIFSRNTIESIRVSSNFDELTRENPKSAQSELEQAVTKAFMNHLLAEEVFINEFRIRELIDRNIEVSYAQEQAENVKGGDLKRWEAERVNATQSIIGAQNNLKVAQVLLNVLMSNAPDEELHLEGDRFNAESTEKLFGRLFPILSDKPTADSIAAKLVEMTGKSAGKTEESFKIFLSGFENLAEASRKLEQKRVTLEESVAQYDGSEFDISQMAAVIDAMRTLQLKEIKSRFEFYDSMSEISTRLGWSAYDSGGSFVTRFEKLVIERK